MSISWDTIFDVSRPEAKPVTCSGAPFVEEVARRLPPVPAELLETLEVDIVIIVIGVAAAHVYGVKPPFANRRAGAALRDVRRPVRAPAGTAGARGRPRSW